MTAKPNWIAERVYEFREGGSAVPRTITARIAVPEPDEGSWRCATLIEGEPSMSDVFYAYGEDSMQALYLGMQGLAVRLKAVGGGGKLTWFGLDDLGLPEPKMRAK